MKVIITVKTELEIGTHTADEVKGQMYEEVKEAIIDHLIDDDYDVDPIETKVTA